VRDSSLAGWILGGTCVNEQVEGEHGCLGATAEYYRQTIRQPVDGYALLERREVLSEQQGPRGKQKNDKERSGFAKLHG
jgi:hypothetical protein